MLAGDPAMLIGHLRIRGDMLIIPLVFEAISYSGVRRRRRNAPTEAHYWEKHLTIFLWQLV